MSIRNLPRNACWKVESRNLARLEWSRQLHEFYSWLMHTIAGVMRHNIHLIFQQILKQFGAWKLIKIISLHSWNRTSDSTQVRAVLNTLNFTCHTCKQRSGKGKRKERQKHERFLHFYLVSITSRSLIAENGIQYGIGDTMWIPSVHNACGRSCTRSHCLSRIF